MLFTLFTEYFNAYMYSRKEPKSGRKKVEHRSQRQSVGQPPKRATSRRVSVGLQISAKTKNAILRLAKENDIGFSRAAEMAIERSFVIDTLLAKQSQSLVGLDLAATRAALLAKSWRYVPEPDGSRVWFEPSPAVGPAFGFIKTDKDSP
jgi:hypothetical protein